MLLLHDIGKPLVTTPEGKAPGHNESGVKVFNQYFSHFFTNKKMKKYIQYNDLLSYAFDEYGKKSKQRL